MWNSHKIKISYDDLRFIEASCTKTYRLKEMFSAAAAFKGLSVVSYVTA